VRASLARMVKISSGTSCAMPEVYHMPRLSSNRHRLVVKGLLECGADGCGLR